MTYKNKKYLRQNHTPTRLYAHFPNKPTGEVFIAYNALLSGITEHPFLYIWKDIIFFVDGTKGEADYYHYTFDKAVERLHLVRKQSAVYAENRLKKQRLKEASFLSSSAAQRVLIDYFGLGLTPGQIAIQFDESNTYNKRRIERVIATAYRVTGLKTKKDGREILERVHRFIEDHMTVCV